MEVPETRIIYITLFRRTPVNNINHALMIIMSPSPDPAFSFHKLRYYRRILKPTTDEISSAQRNIPKLPSKSEKATEILLNDS